MGRRKHPHRVKTLFILRGLPGTLKTEKAWALQRSRGGVVISADDYFRDEFGVIRRRDSELYKSHIWARKNALQAMEDGVDPVIIDNTNMTCWDMFPYVIMGYRRLYWIKFIVMKDTWRLSLDELYESRCNRKVPMEKLEHMKSKYQSVRHIYDILRRDKKSQKWWNGPEMIDNGWDDISNSDSY